MAAWRGMRGPSPESFLGWLRGLRKKSGGAIRKLRVFTEDGEKLIALQGKGLESTVKLVEELGATKVEAIDGEGAMLGQWEFVDKAAPDEDEPGFKKDPADTEEERLLKTFAHLLADAHKQSTRQLVEVVGIQSRHFQEERRNLLTLRMQN